MDGCRGVIWVFGCDYYGGWVGWKVTERGRLRSFISKWATTLLVAPGRNKIHSLHSYMNRMVTYEYMCWVFMLDTAIYRTASISDGRSDLLTPAVLEYWGQQEANTERHLSCG